MGQQDVSEEVFITKLKEAFPRLKKVCDAIAINPSGISNASNLKDVLDTIDPDILERYSEYSLIPIYLRIAEGTDSSSETVCRVLECLAVLLEYLPVSESQFWKICSMTFRHIYSETDDDYASKLPEELKLQVIQCITLLFKRASNSILPQIYSSKYAGRLSVIVYHSVQLAKKEKWVLLRVASLKLIQAVFQLETNNNSLLSCSDKIANLSSMMLPGVIGCAVSVATSTDTLNHKVVVEAIKVWGNTIGLVMRERKCDSSKADVTFKLSPMGTEKASNQKNVGSSSASTPLHSYQQTDGFVSIITEEWLQSSAQKLAGPSEKMMSLHDHNHWRVRNQLVVAVSHILSTSPINMSPSVNHLVDALIFLSRDSHDKVSSESKRALDDFSKTCEVIQGCKKLVEIVEESFYNLITKLPRTLHGFDLTLKEKQLSLLSGYVGILGSKHFPRILNSAQHLNRLLKSLYVAATLDSSNVSLLAEQAVRNLDEEPERYLNTWKVLKCNDTERYFSTLKSLTRSLLTFSDSGTIIHLLCDDYENQPVHRKEITLLFIFIFSNDGADLSVNDDLVNHVLKTVMEPKLWELPVNVVSSEQIMQAKSNVVQICLLTELVAALAQAKGADAFTSHLIDCLYPILECAGSPLFALACAGLGSLKSLANLYLVDIERLLATNMDYLSYKVTVNLRHAHRNPRVLSVLFVIMKHSTVKGFPSLHEVIKDLLAQSWDHWQHMSVSAFLQVFLTFITQLSYWNPVSDAVSCPEKKLPPNSLWNKFMDYYDTSVIARSTSDKSVLDGLKEEESNYHPMEAETGKDSSPTIPDHVTLTVDILNCCLNYLPSKDVAQQILVLQVLEKGVLVLSNWKDQLLPVVHKIWAPLVQRFSPDMDPLVIHRSFVLLCTLARTSEDFIRTRTMKSVVPFLGKYLQKQVCECEQEGGVFSYKMTQSYKLVQAVLHGLGDLALSMSVEYEELELIVDMVLPYLSSKQPCLIQDAATSTIRRLITKDPHIVWAHLMSACPNPSEFKSPSRDLRSFQIEGQMSAGNYLQKSVATHLGKGVDILLHRGRG